MTMSIVSLAAEIGVSEQPVGDRKRRRRAAFGAALGAAGDRRREHALRARRCFVAVGRGRGRLARPELAGVARVDLRILGAVPTHARRPTMGGLPGLRATGRQMVIGGVQIDRFGGDQIAESWRYWDTLGMLQQPSRAPSRPSGCPPDRAERQARDRRRRSSSSTARGWASSGATARAWAPERRSSCASTRSAASTS